MSNAPPSPPNQDGKQVFLALLLGLGCGAVCGAIILSTGELFHGDIQLAAVGDLDLPQFGAIWGAFIGAIVAPLGYSRLLKAIGLKKSLLPTLLGTLIGGLAGTFAGNFVGGNAATFVAPPLAALTGIVGFLLGARWARSHHGPTAAGGIRPSTPPPAQPPRAVMMALRNTLITAGVFWLSEWIELPISVAFGKLNGHFTHRDSFVAALGMGVMWSLGHILAAILAGMIVALTAAGRRPERWALLIAVLDLSFQLRIYMRWQREPASWDYIWQATALLAPPAACLVAAWLTARRYRPDPNAEAASAPTP
jgi:hypothetical protein